MYPFKFRLVIIIFTAILFFHCQKKNPVSTQQVEKTTITHETDIYQNETWKAENIHLVTALISIKNAVVTIESGTKVQFDDSAGICVMDSAGLMADSVLFTSFQGGKGSWKYIYFADSSRDDSCRLTNSVIEQGGGDQNRGTIIFCDNAKPTISNCTITQSPSTGIIFYGDCRGINFQGNVITSCDFVPIETYAENVSSIGVTTFQDNRINQVRVVSGKIQFDDQWHNPGVPYRMADGLLVDNVSLTLLPGVQLLFEYDETALITNKGSIKAAGTTTNKIIFTGSDIGRWNGIVFSSTADAANSQLTYCVIEKGGQDNFRPANIVLENVSPVISNCLIQQSLGYGIYISGTFNTVGFNNNIITDNTLAPVSIAANSLNRFTPGAYMGNGNDVIEVRGGQIDGVIMADEFWEAIGIPYLLRDKIQILYSTLTLAPGVTLLMVNNTDIEVLTQGGFIADGSSAMIRINGFQPTIGLWNSIYFSSTANAYNCILINCQVNYGGGNINRPGMIYCDDVSPTIRNCFIEYSQSWGIYLTGNAAIQDIQSNVFFGNGYGSYYNAP